MTQPYLKFHDGHRMPQLGAGVWQVPDSDTPALVRAALEAGYRLIDTAKIYGNERGVGEGLAGSDIPRNEVFITTKLWNADQGRDKTLRAFDESMAALRLDYLDLYLIHWPVPAQNLAVESWKAMIELRDAGRVRSIGVANFHAAHLDQLIDATGIVPVLNQIELHPHLIQTAMRAKDDALGIITQSWSPLGQSILLSDPDIVEMAKAHGVTPAQLILAWHLGHGLSVIPKTLRATRLAENFGALKVHLSNDEMTKLDQMDRAHRFGPNPDEFGAT
ncbi:aldo/keto reductase [Paracoccus aminophilus]|uniref:2,5-didehydrogluconate reductase n=1 Tax=Paracoccus aminophilus JCM 7686 TaxID=1367847 RepID=S5XQU7_PARAH|nr:aldo/keto reductase [Paracoccus aminophilus]AGT07442.1 2,5-didehydrogluconate reductase [Paracoccus aminophilus JCM 7686]